MLCINLTDGRTLHFDLTEQAESSRWEVLQADAHFQQTVTGIGILRDGRTHIIPMPRRFRTVNYRAELIRREDGVATAECVVCQADDVEFSLLVYLNGSGSMARMNITKTGWRRCSPPRSDGGK